MHKINQNVDQMNKSEMLHSDQDGSFSIILMFYVMTVPRLNPGRAPILSSPDLKVLKQNGSDEDVPLRNEYINK